jgi:acyl-CoA reductase-like NAD-dependent aldehyde dehydrogenase
MVTSPLPADLPADLDAAIDRLHQHKTTWPQVSIAQRLDYLQQCLAGVLAVADGWATAACKAKGIDPTAPLAGEEWIAGPVATLLNLRFLMRTLAAKGQPAPVQSTIRTDGQTVAQVFPDTLMDRLMWLGFRADVWLEPGKPTTQGRIYREAATGDTGGAIALILGAGNISAIAPMDCLYKLFAENQVVLLKLNPVNAYIGPFLERAFQPLIAAGFWQIVYGGAEVGQALCQHPRIDTIHITGSHHTHDAILWGDTPTAQQQNKQQNQPQLDKDITSELGCVTPILVVPGEWSAADMAFQARQVASMVAHNASFNCVAAKVLVTAQDWPQREEFLAQVHRQLAQTPARKAYYPGAVQRYQAFLAQYPQAQVLGKAGDASADSEPGVPWTVLPNVAPHADSYALTTEAFCGVIAEVSLPAGTAPEFLAAAVPFANETVWGNLSCVVLVDPATQRRHAAAMDGAIAQLRYGAIGVNAWTGMTFLLASTPWGAFPGNALTDIRSGRGVVHNTYLFDHPQKSVLYAPFRIFPTPIWFADHANLLQVARRYAGLVVRPSWGKFLGVVAAALSKASPVP